MQNDRTRLRFSRRSSTHAVRSSLRLANFSIGRELRNRHWLQPLTSQACCLFVLWPGIFNAVYVFGSLHIPAFPFKYFDSCGPGKGTRNPTIYGVQILATLHTPQAFSLNHPLFGLAQTAQTQGNGVTGEKIPLRLVLALRVAGLKVLLEELLAIPQREMKLSYKGKVLDDRRGKSEGAWVAN